MCNGESTDELAGIVNEKPSSMLAETSILLGIPAMLAGLYLVAHAVLTLLPGRPSGPWGTVVAVPAVLAGILGLCALREIRDSRGKLSGRGLALAGVLSACVGFVSAAVFMWDRVKTLYDLELWIESLHRTTSPFP